MEKRIATIIVCLLIISFAFGFWMHSEPLVLGATARAVGDLTVDWGVAEGNPIFSISNMSPGQTEIRTVTIKNEATNGRPVAIRTVKSSEVGDLSTVLDFEIKDGSTVLYTNTLDQFFSDGGEINGIELFVISPNQTKTLTFAATFQESADDTFQNTSVIFDLIIGIAFDIPQECQNIKFAGLPIFGTENKDKLKGTNGNDLIIAFEGDDTVDGSNGDDCIIGGDGNDKLDGSNGIDIILGGAGDDKINASNGNDKVYAGEGNDTIDGSNGDDYIIGGLGTDNAKGGNGTDTCEAETKTSCEL